MSTYMIYCNS